jgi:hypothetical protein
MAVALYPPVPLSSQIDSVTIIFWTLSLTKFPFFFIVLTYAFQGEKQLTTRSKCSQKLKEKLIIRSFLSKSLLQHTTGKTLKEE